MEPLRFILSFICVYVFIPISGPSLRATSAVPEEKKITGCSHLLFCVIYPHLQDRATELHRPIQRKKKGGLQLRGCQVAAVFSVSLHCLSGPLDQWFIF